MWNPAVTSAEKTLSTGKGVAVPCLSTCPPMCDTPQHDMLQYSSSSLRAIGLSMSPLDMRLPKDVYQLTLDLGIGKRHHVHRGSRGGKAKKSKSG